MDSRSLTPEQRKKLVERLGPTVRYLARMHGRMNQRLFPQDDPLLNLTRKAHQAMLDLLTEVRSGRR